jgi:DNA polymerase-3 subunit alpha|tara:strand:- start:35556 stop:38111 length:2556 start_codon:yes stop_codon:yes gene_type:complete
MSDQNKMKFIDKFEKLDIPIHGVRLPEMEITDAMKNNEDVPLEADNLEFLRQLALNGYKKRGIDLKANKKEYIDRAKEELKVIIELGFVDYFLMVWDVIDFCEKKDIPTGLGRGSAAGSLLLYLMGVTKIDPIEYGLYFERFVSKVRAKSQVVDGITYLDGNLMCDVDLDLCYYRRKEVIEYLEQKYEGRTSKILTFNTLSSKLLVKECGKIIGEMSESDVNQVSNMIPKDAGQVFSLQRAYDSEEDFQVWADEHRNIYEVALKLRNLNKNKGVHPAGQLISFDLLEESCPTELSSDKAIVASFDMGYVSLSNVKLDLLGLRGVSVVDDVCKAVGINMLDIDLNSPEIYRNLQDLTTPHGLFQIEADLAFQFTKKVKPKNLEELSGVLALARPGALAFVDQYAAYTNHGTYEPIHTFFDDILQPTGGVCLYQEQLMRMVNKIGFSLDDSEQVRRCVGKKKVEEMAKWEEKIASKIADQKLDPEIGNVLWDIAQASAKYQFNKSHSLCYAALAAITVYLKFKYPKQFFLSLLKMTKFEPDPMEEIYKIQKEMPDFKIKLLQPHLLKSKMDFAIKGDDIRFGLTSIKGISERSWEKLDQFRSEYDNKFEVFEAAENAGINVGVLAALIQAGCFEGYRNSRSYTVYEAQLWNVMTPREKVFIKAMGEDHNYEIVPILSELKSKLNEKGKRIIKDTRITTIKKRSEKITEIYKLNKKNENLANWWYETKLLGYSCSGSLSNVYKEKVADIASVKEVNISANKTKVIFAAIVSGKVKRGKSRRGNEYVKMDLKDETDEVKAMIFERSEKNMSVMPKQDDIVLVKGTSTGDGTVFCDLVAVQSVKIYTKLSDLRNLK